MRTEVGPRRTTRGTKRTALGLKRTVDGLIRTVLGPKRTVRGTDRTIIGPLRTMPGIKRTVLAMKIATKAQRKSGKVNGMMNDEKKEGSGIRGQGSEKKEARKSGRTGKDGS